MFPESERTKKHDEVIDFKCKQIKKHILVISHYGVVIYKNGNAGNRIHIKTSFMIEVGTYKYNIL